MRDLEEIASLAVDCGFQIHKEVGPGLLESAYEAIMAAALVDCGLTVERQRPVPIAFRSLTISEAFRADLIVNGSLIIEVKSTERNAAVYSKQLLTYLRLMKQPLGLLMNFGCATFKEGISRVVNNHTDFASSRLRVNQSQSDG